MSLLNKLTQQGSVLSANNGGPIATNPLATKQSKLHADGSNPGYSLNGANASQVNNAYQEYVHLLHNIILTSQLNKRKNMKK